jgi:hypothetical protein
LDSRAKKDRGSMNWIVNGLLTVLVIFAILTIIDVVGIILRLAMIEVKMLWKRIVGDVKNQEEQ